MHDVLGNNAPAPIAHRHRLRVLIACHPWAALLWLTSIALMTFATMFNNLYLGLWALLVALTALIASAAGLTFYAINRLTQVMGFFADDVPLDTDAVSPLRQPGRRRRRRPTGDTGSRSWRAR